MTNANLKKMVEEKILELMVLANGKFNRDFPFPEMNYTLTGKCAGRARTPRENITMHHPRTALGLIKINLDIMRNNLDDYLARTVRHELAHLIDAYLYGRTKPHGRNWKAVMYALGDRNPTVCHNYNMDNVKTRRMKKSYIYACDCMEHSITIIRHRRALAGSQTYVCKTCRKNITFTGRMG